MEIFAARLPHDLLNDIDIMSNRSEVFNDVAEGSDTEFLVPVQTTELALIPRTVPGDPKL